MTELFVMVIDIVKRVIASLCATYISRFIDKKHKNNRQGK